MNWFDTTLILLYYSYTNGSHKGFVEFCVIEVFKFWVMLRWMKEGQKSLSLGMPQHPNLLCNNEQPTKLGDAPELKEICPRGNNKVVIYISLYHDKCLLFMLELYQPETQYMCEYIDKQSVTIMPLLDQLVESKMVKFPNHRHELSFD